MNSSYLQEQELFKKIYESMHVDGRLMPVGHLLKRMARLSPHNIALISDQQEITYRNLYGCASLFSKKLVDSGIQPRDRVILLFENSIEFYIAYFGILQIGAIVVPLNIFLQDREIAHVINDAQPTCFVTSTKFAQRVQDLDVEKMPLILTEEDIVLDNVVAQGTNHVSTFSPDPEELTVLLYTSGTTGLPKGVMISSKNIMTNVAQGLTRFQLLGQERIFGVLPLFHSFAQIVSIWMPFFLGYTVIVIAKIDRHYITRGLAHKPTIFSGVPALYGLLCLLRTAPLASVRLFISGGDALSSRIYTAFALLYRRKICSGYGLTETTPLVAVGFEDITAPINSVGKPVVGVTCAFKDEEGNEVPKGSVGELWVKGDNVMLGYYNAPEMTEHVLKDGWFNTGDLAYLDKRGNLIIAGRTKDLIIQKGIKIYPQEVENVISTHPEVIRVGVIGQDDQSDGEIPIAHVQVKTMTPNLVKELRALCVKNLAAYKVPRDFILTTQELPITATGKVNKKLLRSQATQG
jgi:long-chain acyl-CoA synthetase